MVSGRRGDRSDGRPSDAPQSGRETRRIIKRKTREGREALSDTGRDLMEKGRDLYEKGLSVADDAAEMIERGRRLVEG